MKSLLFFVIATAAIAAPPAYKVTGKTTTGKMILRLIDPSEGEISLNGTRIDNLSRAAMRARFPQTVLISPLCPSFLPGCTRFHVGEVLVAYR